MVKEPHAAIACGSVECVKQLLAKKPDVSKTTVDNLNVLHTAVRIGHPEIVRLLLEYATNNDNNLNPLELAVYNRHNWSELHNEMRKHKRSIGSKHDFDIIISYLQQHKIH